MALVRADEVVFCVGGCFFLAVRGDEGVALLVVVVDDLAEFGEGDVQGFEVAVGEDGLDVDVASGVEFEAFFFGAVAEEPGEFFGDLDVSGEGASGAAASPSSSAGHVDEAGVDGWCSFGMAVSCCVLTYLPSTERMS